MKKFIYIIIVVIVSAGLLVACGGGGSNLSPTTTNTESNGTNDSTNESTTNETVNNTNNGSNEDSNSQSDSNSNSTSTQTSNSTGTGGDSSSTINNTNVNVVTQINQGQLPTYNQQTDDLNDVAVLNVHTVFDTGNNRPIESLKMCNEHKCWTLIDENNTSQRASRRSVAQRLTASKSTENLGSFTVAEDGLDISFLRYKYNGSEGEIQFEKSTKISKSSSRNLYLEVSNILSVSLNSISIPSGENTIYLSQAGLNKEFSDGIILEIPSSINARNAVLNIEQLNDVVKIDGEKLPVKSFSVNLINISEFNNNPNLMVDQFPDELEFSITVYLPVLEEFDKEGFVLLLNGDNTNYELTSKDGKKYISFITNKTKFNALFMQKREGMEI